MGITDTLLNSIVQRILQVCHPERIILFGSAAAGNMTRDSDIDLLVVEPALGNAFQESTRINDALRGLGYAFDIVVISSRHFRETGDVIGGIAYPARK